MRILFLGNNWLGWQILRWLKAQDENIVGVVVHGQDKAKHRAEIIECAGVAPAQVFNGANLRDSLVVNAIRALESDIAISVLFGHILCWEFIDLFPAGAINLHPSYLPYNRGAFPNVWSIIEGTPAGVTLHYIDAGIDTGDIIAQKQVAVSPTDTGETLYRRLELEALDLFSETWPLVREGKPPRQAFPANSGTAHRVRDIETIDEIDLAATYKAKDLIDRLRARTFPPYRGAYFRSDGRKVYLSLNLAYGEEGDL